MTDTPILTDAALDAMLARRAGRGAPPGLAASIATALAATPEARGPWWTALAPPAGRSPAFRMVWIVATVGLLLAATVSAIWVGSQLLRRDSELTVVPRPTVVLTIAAHSEGVSAVAWSPDGSRLATASRAIGGRSGTARVWDATTGEALLRFPTGSAETTRVEMAYSPDGTRLAFGGPADAVFDAATGDMVLGGIGDRALAYSPDGTRLAVGGAWGWAAVIDAVTGDELLTLPTCPPARSWVWAAAWSPDGTRLATTCRTSITAWDAATGDQQLAISGLVTVTDVAWSPDGSRIAAASDDAGSVRIHSATTGDELATLTGHAMGIQGIEWSPDGARIATAGSDGTARIWGATTGDELATLTGHAARVTDVAWSPDGTRIASASEDGTVRIWHVPRMVAPTPSAAVPPTVAPAPSAAPSPALPPVALEPVGEPTVSESALGTITWRLYTRPEGEYFWGFVSTPYLPVAIDGTKLRWIGPDATLEETILPEVVWGLAPVGDGLIAYGRGQAHLISWDGTRWVVGDALDVPAGLLASTDADVRVVAGPHGVLIVSCQPTHCRGTTDGVAVAADGRHFVGTAAPPGGGDRIGPVLATADGFVAFVSEWQDSSSVDPMVEPVPWFSEDGLAWEPASQESPFGEGARIRGVAGRFVAVGNIGSSDHSPWAVWVSDDGRGWVRLPGLGPERAEVCIVMEGCRLDVTSGAAGWVIHKGSSFWASADGRTWEPLRGPAIHGDWVPPQVALGRDTILVAGYLDPWGPVVAVGTIEP